MTWPVDKTKLDRVRALMNDQDLSALVCRAPDNVLYLTNYWCMKGYDAVIFPRDGEPTLIALEPQQADAERNSWTKDILYFKGYDERDPRPPQFRAWDRAYEVLKKRGLTDKVAVELNMGTQSADRMVGEPTTFMLSYFESFKKFCGEVVDATPLLNEVRSIKTDQEVERMRLANELAALAMDYTREHMRPGMKESEVGAMYEGFVHGIGVGYKGKVEMARAFTLIWSGKGIATFTATGDRPIQKDEPTLFEIWVCADGYWTDLTKNACPGELKPEYHKLLDLLLKVFNGAVSFARDGCELSRTRQAHSRAHRRRWIPRTALPPHLPWRRRPRPRVALRAPSRRRSDEERDGAGDRAWHLLARRRRPALGRRFPDHRIWQRKNVH